MDERRRAVCPRAGPAGHGGARRGRRARATAGRLVRRRHLQAAHAGRQAVHGLQPVSPPLARAGAAHGASCPGRAAGAAERPAQGPAAALDTLGLGDGAAPLAEPFREPGEPAARAALARWLDGPIDAYDKTHDLLADDATSGLSPYLRWGCLSAAECEQRAERHGGAGASAWIRQLAWREFYAHVLLSHPDNARLEFQPRYRELEWVGDDDAFDAWREGRTGYPLVDAGMRQLARSGWMHNRARLVVGSFLTKDLHLDWRLGEAHFEALLLDGEPAQNNGNWQWVSSVGVDPAPYFRRLFNPMLQQRKFDPDGVYVRRWVPELRDVPVRAARRAVDDVRGRAGRRELRHRPRLPRADRRARTGAPAGDRALPGRRLNVGEV